MYTSRMSPMTHYMCNGVRLVITLAFLVSIVILISSCLHANDDEEQVPSIQTNQVQNETGETSLLRLYPALPDFAADCGYFPRIPTRKPTVQPNNNRSRMSWSSLKKVKGLASFFTPILTCYRSLNVTERSYKSELSSVTEVFFSFDVVPSKLANMTSSLLTLQPGYTCDSIEVKGFYPVEYPVPASKISRVVVLSERESQDMHFDTYSFLFGFHKFGTFSEGETVPTRILLRCKNHSNKGNGIESLLNTSSHVPSLRVFYIAL